MQNQKLCLKWNNHMSNMLSLLGSFQQKDMLVDVTISCQGQNIKAHKIILSACSPYFQNIFMENPCQHPIIIINGMKFEDITAILNFMYKGEVNVSHDGLSSFLQAAEALKVKGLAEVCGEKKGTNSISQEVQQSELNRPQRTDTPPRKRPRNRKRSLSDSNRSDDEGLSRKHREPSSPEVHELSGDESFTGDNSSNGPPFNSISRVPQNVYSRSHQSSSNMGGEDDDEYDVESNKMLDTTDSNVSMNNTNTDNNLRIERIMGNATEIESSSMADPESPPDIKPIINFGEASAGPSEGGNLMLYNEQSQPGPSNVQDSSLLQHDNSHAQDKDKGYLEIDVSKPDDKFKRTLYMCSDCQEVCGTVRTIKSHKKSCTKGSAAPDGDYVKPKKKKEKVSLKSKETGFCEIDASKPGDKYEKSLYMCSDCRFICRSLPVMKRHKKVCDRNKGNEKVPSNKGLPTDLKTTMFVCPECDFYCPSENGMKLHYKVCTGGNVSVACQTILKSESIACQVGTPRVTPLVVSAPPCSNIDADGYSLPENKVSIECQTEPVKIMRGKAEKVYCTYCTYSTKIPYNLKKHLITHTGEKNYACTYCDKMFADNSSRMTHERTHTGLRPYACDICNKTFGTSVVRNRHKIRWHTDERPFVCDICYVGFKFKADLKSHMRTHY